MNIAYKVSKGAPNLPDGFVIEHFETTADNLEGYQVTSKEGFSNILANNGALYQQWEVLHRNVNTTPAPELTPEPLKAPTPAIVNPTPAVDPNTALFEEFLAWKAAQGNNS